MANNTEDSSAGLMRRRSDNEEPPPIPSGSHSKLDSTIKSILRKRVDECQDSKKSCLVLLARIKVLEHHAAEGTIPKGLRIRNIKAKGNNETLQAKFDDIIREAELKLLDAAIDNLCTDVEANREELRAREANVDGTICKWKTYLIQSKEITSEQVDSLVEMAASFAENLSSDNAVNWASKAPQAETTLKESKLRESMESNEAFIPSEQLIRQIIRQEIHHANDVQPVASDRQRKVSFSSNPGRQSHSKRQQHKPRRQGSSKSPQSCSKSPRSNPSKRVNRPHLSAKNAQGKGSGPVKYSRSPEEKRLFNLATRPLYHLLPRNLEIHNFSRVNLTERQSKVLGMGL